MTYATQTWADAPSTSSPIDAARLGHMEAGIKSAHRRIESLGWTLASDFGVVGNGTTDDTAALLAAIAATPANGVLYVGPGTYKHTATLALAGRSLIGAGINATTFQPTAIGTGYPAISTSGASNASKPLLSDFAINGPGTRVLGVKNADVDGIHYLGQGQPITRRVMVQNCDRGLMWANASGHLYFSDLNITNNFYGVYCGFNSFDYFISDSVVNGNTFANMATAADQGFAGLVMRNVHFGFAPYGIYQEATPTNQGNKVFLEDVILEHVRFEAIGNAAIQTDATASTTGSVNVSDTANLTITHPGFSWNTTYKISSRAAAYALDLGFTTRIIEIHGGISPFTPGSSGATYRARLANHDAFIVQQAGTVVPLVGATGNETYGALPFLGSPFYSDSYRLNASTGYLRFTSPTGDLVRIGGANSGGVYFDHDRLLQGRNSGAGYANAWSIHPDGGIQCGAYATSGRPSAAGHVVGTMIYDTTLHKPIWSDGAIWRDSAGLAA